VERLGSSDIREREEARELLVKKGRPAYASLRKALASSDEDLKSRAVAVAWAMGMDPESHRGWEEIWADYRKAPADALRGRLVALGERIAEPRLTLMRKIDEGLFAESPECAWGGKELAKGAPEIAEWEVADEVIAAALADPSKEWQEKLAQLFPGEKPNDEKRSVTRAWTLFAWGVHLLQRSAPRARVMAAWKCLLRACPGSRYDEQVKGYVAALEKMIPEDVAAKFDKPVDAMTAEQQAAYWVFALRDVRAQQWSQPGYCQITATDDPAPAKLKALGKPAIAALMECLGDRRLTRSIGFWRDFSPNRTVLTYHDAAVQLLDDMTGLALYQRASTSDYPSLKGEEGLVKAYRDWWAKAKSQEPEDWWAESLESPGERPRAEAARRLFASRGDACVPTLLKALAHAGADKHGILEVLGAAQGDAILPALRKELAAGPTAHTLRTLALAMGRHGSEEGLEKLAEASKKSTQWDLRADLSALVASGRWKFEKLAIDVAGDGTLEISRRLTALDALEAWKPASDDEARVAVRAIAPMLDMIAETGSVTSWGDGVVVKSRVCDVAAQRLAKWFPGDAAFELKAETAARTKQIEKIGAWARGFGK
jgi:hypothetical protein